MKNSLSKNFSYCILIIENKQVQFKWNGKTPGKELAFHQLYKRKERKGAKDFVLGFNATVLDTGKACTKNIFKIQ